MENYWECYFCHKKYDSWKNWGRLIKKNGAYHLLDKHISELTIEILKEYKRLYRYDKRYLKLVNNELKARIEI